MSVKHASMVAILTAVLISFGTTAGAKSKPWDVDRFIKCLRTIGSDQLAPNLIITSQHCNSGRDPVAASENAPNSLRALAWVTGARSKDNPKHAFVAIAFGTRIERIATFVGGSTLTRDTGGAVSFRSAVALVGGQRQELATQFEQPQTVCSQMSRGAFASETCSFTEAGLVTLSDALLDELARTHASDPAAQFRFRVETATGSITLVVPVAEIEAVRLAVFPSTIAAP